MDATEKTDVNTICLRNAVLCAECEVISDSPHDTCRVCGSHSLLSMSRVLGGTLPAQRAHLVDTWVSSSERPILSLDHRTHRKRMRRAVA